MARLYKHHFWGIHYWEGIKKCRKIEDFFIQGGSYQFFFNRPKTGDFWSKNTVSALFREVVQNNMEMYIHGPHFKKGLLFLDDFLI